MIRARLLAFLPALLLAGALVAAREPAPETWVVIVGVNDYVHSEGLEDGDLRGAEPDALAMRDVLRDRWEVPEENMRVLLSLEATRAAIEDAFTDWLPARAQPGDQVIFYYSGHGGQAIDDDGDEDDGLDETICPTDVLPSSFRNDIRDDQIGEWVDALPTRNVVVILDSCHSGTGTRAVVESMRPRFLDRGLVDRPEVATRALGEAGADATPAGSGEGMVVPSPGLIELAAAAPAQPAMEGFFGREVPGGAFTMHLVRQLWQAPPTATYGQVFRRVATGMRTDHFTQDPQFHGEETAPILGGGAAGVDATQSPAPAPSDEVRVSRVDGARVVLSGGSARGITEGSVYETAGGALLRVASVGTSTAEALPVGGQARVGETAQLLEVSLPERDLEVGTQLLDPELGSALADRLAGTVQLTADPDREADLFLASTDDGLWIEVLGRDGGLRDRIPRVGGTGAALDAVAGMLRKELAVKRLGALENPAAPFDVELSVAGGERRFRLGDEIFFEITSERAGYLTLVDLGTDGTVTVLYPNEWEDLGRLEPGRVARVPEGSAKFELVPPPGSGLVRAILTPEPLGIVYTENGYATSDDGATLAARIRALLEGGTGSDQGGARAWATSAVVYEVAPD